MGNIPLPALDIQTRDPLNEYAKLVSIKSALQKQQTQNALAPLQVQQAQMQNTLEQQKITDAQVWADSLRANKGDLEASLKDTIQGGKMSGVGVANYASNVYQMMYQHAHATKEQLDAQKETNDMLAGNLETVRNAGPEGSPERAAAVEQIRPVLAQKNPALAKAIPVGAPSDKDLDSFEANLMGAQWAASNALKRREVSAQETASAARDSAAKTEADTFAAKMPGGALYAPTLAGQEATARVNAETSPTAIAGAAQKAGAEANARIPAAVQTEVQKAQALAPKLDEITQTMTSGRKYVDLSKLTGPQRSLIQQQAAAAGIPTVDKDTASTLSDIDTARMNQKYMLDTISRKLPTGPMPRFYQAPENTLEKFGQTDPTLAAIGTYRSAAIQSMRAVAGSKGLRINRQEIEMAIDNDIPKMTDTLPTAQQKLKNMQAFLDNAEGAHLTQNRATGSPAQAGAQQPSGWGAKFGGKQIQGVQQ